MDTNRRSAGGDAGSLTTRPAANAPTLGRRVKTWPAYLLAACCPGVGHLYFRQWARALSWAGLYGAALVFLSSGVLLAEGSIVEPIVVTAVRLEGLSFGDVAVPLAIVVLNVIDLVALATLEARSGGY
ncbi:hypothetical protein ACFO5R_21340 [Halosolutus amylolyticus]|uniref:Uncharacterized protein n=1 Tax=Halosolutus amylolyticus TaxID=2932267 RepID=A0ABD5PVW4_9EURY|nr:hypothetical protein [Halosolutus amylolyticus]